MSSSVESDCPYCGEPVELFIDDDGGNHQVFVEDCAVCCRPWQVEVTLGGDDSWSVSLRTIDE